MGIRSRITIIAAIVVLAVLSIAGVALATTQRAVLTDAADEVLSRQSIRILESWTNGLTDATIPGQGDDESFAVLTDATGTVLAATSTTAGSLELAPPPDDRVVYTTLTDASSGTVFRVRAESIDSLVVYVATPLDDVNDSVAALSRGLWVFVPITTALLALAVWILVGRVLRPVEAIRRQVSDIRATTLDRRVPEPQTHDEIARLAKTMNEMLDRIEKASMQQQQFVDDASHELRTPLTRIRSELELGESPLRTTLLADVAELEHLIEDLLTMARHEATVSETPVDLDDVVIEVIESLRRAHPTLEIDSGHVSAARTRGSRSQLGRVVSNLLDNARLHGAGAVTVDLAERDGRAILRISDRGQGVLVGEADRMFDRFVRLDDARARNGSGAGLGLSISRAIVVAHGGTVMIDTDYTDGARFVVDLPLAS